MPNGLTSVTSAPAIVSDSAVRARGLRSATNPSHVAPRIPIPSTNDPWAFAQASINRRTDATAARSPSAPRAPFVEQPEQEGEGRDLDRGRPDRHERARVEEGDDADRQRDDDAESPAPNAGDRQEEGQRREGTGEEAVRRGSERVVEEGHDALGQPLVGDPGRAAGRPRVDVAAGKEHAVEQVAAVGDVPAVVGIGRRAREVGEREQGEDGDPEAAEAADGRERTFELAQGARHAPILP